MSNRDKYIAAFKQTLLVEDADLVDLKYQDIAAWDSVGHMSLMATLEECFKIELEIDDIIEFSSFEVGKTILSKYGVIMEQPGA